MKKKKLRIFIGPGEISGFFSNLAAAMKADGIDASFVSFTEHPYKYQSGKGSLIETYIRKLNKKITTSNKIKRRFWALLREILLYCFFIKALFEYDVFIFVFANSLLRNNIDLPILKLFRKKVISNLSMGSEARPPYIDGSYQSQKGEHNSVSLDELERITKLQREKIKFIEQYSDVIIGAPYTSQFLNQKVVNSTALGFPTQARHRVLEVAASANIIILHAPSNPVAKGTLYIRQLIKEFQEQGYDIEYRELKNQPNEKVIEALNECSFVIDQLYSDAVMPGLVTEAALYGKPSVVGGYSLNELRNYVPDTMFPPSEICHPNEFKEAIEKMILDRSYRESRGNAAREFVLSKWAVGQISNRFQKIIDGDIPDDWVLDPRDVVYVYGWGQSEQKTKQIIRNLVERYGVGALQLGHNPKLEKAFLDFAEIR